MIFIEIRYTHFPPPHKILTTRLVSAISHNLNYTLLTNISVRPMKKKTPCSVNDSEKRSVGREIKKKCANNTKN